ncbi:MAG: type II toxin-antitoxin system CcdA family antitoxin [Alphaproteobacteria bacterium]|nr:type II toxin-antitoxin system CcdA family antitoxin [Alphaproteobacteria bacterium]MBU0863571.1 type II toxin-antitoxin system CcdA family antitoxin [Alphaproteobacteria bacterium]MBU1823645.1 type II toxin-antitoxin system CcdA family antitoxin [Alphaproteobacteria bacterium]
MLGEAKRLGINVSAACERGLRERVDQRLDELSRR